jgi:hypothetical protein
MIHRVPFDILIELWPAIDGYAERVCHYHPFLDAKDLLTLAAIGHVQFFVVTDGKGVSGFAAMEVIQYPRRTVANCLACGGQKGFLSVAVNELLPVLQAWGREQGADTFALTGRPGWLRALRHLNGESCTYASWWTPISEQRRRHIENHADHGTLERGSAVHH